MARLTYGRSSPYANTPQTRTEIGIYRHRPIPNSPDDQVITLDARHQYRPDKLAFELYGTPKLWWVFMVRNINLVRDPLNDFKAGLIIYAPTYDQLKKALGI